MVAVTLPPAEDHPEFYEAMLLLVRAKQTVNQVFRVYAAGDALAETQMNSDGVYVSRETILFTDQYDCPRTAIVVGKDKVISTQGWGEKSKLF